MTAAEALRLIEGAVPAGPGIWADLGAGAGVFTRALAARLGPGGRIYAVDRDARALDRAASSGRRSRVEVIPVVADFTGEVDLPGAGRGGLDGLLAANALHYVADPGPVLSRLSRWLRVGGRAVVVEYDRRAANRWVPHPIPAARWPALAAAAGWSEPVVTARRASAYGGDLYVVAAERLAAAAAGGG